VLGGAFSVRIGIKIIFSLLLWSDADDLCIQTLDNITHGLAVTTSTPDAFTQTIRTDYERWGRVVDAAGAKLN